MMDVGKYGVGYYPAPGTHTKWVMKDHVEKAPIWCSVDMRDGNQALVIPMNMEEKLEFFQLLLDVGFKEIEVGFPAASETEYEFLRTLIDNNMIPEDVTMRLWSSRPAAPVVSLQRALHAFSIAMPLTLVCRFWSALKQ